MTLCLWMPYKVFKAVHNYCYQDGSKLFFFFFGISCGKTTGFKSLCNTGWFFYDVVLEISFWVSCMDTKWCICPCVPLTHFLLSSVPLSICFFRSLPLSQKNQKWPSPWWVLICSCIYLLLSLFFSGF